MNIIVSNDDGIFKEGIHVLVKALRSIPDVKLYVFAPDSERTAASMSLTTREPIHIEEYDMPGADEAWSVSGTPVDCVRFGAYILRSRGIEPDLVCTGINHGANVGGDCYFSGTVGAATQGVMVDIPAIAFSICSHQPVSEHFELFYDLVPQVVNKAYGHIPKFTVVNVNVPNLPKEELKGIKVCRLGRHYYKEFYKDLGNGDYQLSLDTGNDFGPEHDPDMDTVAVLEKYVTIGPYSIRQLKPGALEEIASWNISL